MFTDWEGVDWEHLQATGKLAFVFWGEEVAPNSGNTHWQGFLQLPDGVRKNIVQLKRYLEVDRVYFAMMRGTYAQNEAYCSKDGECHQFGEWRQNGRPVTYAEYFAWITESQPTLEEAIEKNPVLYSRYRNGVRDLIGVQQKKRAKADRPTTVMVFSGPTGTGKTREAMRWAGYKINGSGLKWWDGYANEDCILIDDYNNDLKVNDLLTLLDRYPQRLPIKGSHTWAAWRCVIITTNLTKEEFHAQAKPRHREALMRRIAWWRDFE